MSEETVTIEMRRGLAHELLDALETEVQRSDEYHTTEQVFEEAADTIEFALNEDR